MEEYCQLELNNVYVARIKSYVSQVNLNLCSVYKNMPIV